MAKLLYDTLKIAEDASEAQIKKAFRKLVKKAHPDSGGSEEQFHLLNRAYRILMDEDARAYYDATDNLEDEDLMAAEEMYLKVLIEAFDAAVQECMTDLDQADIIEAMKEGMRDSSNSLRSAVNQGEVARGKLQRFRKRLMVKGKRKNVFTNSVDHLIELRAKEIAHNTRAYRITDLCLGELSFYKSPIDLMYSFGMGAERPDSEGPPRQIGFHPERYIERR